MLGWIFSLFGISLAVWALYVCRKQQQRLGRVQKLLQKTKTQLFKANEEHSEKEIQHEVLANRLRTYLQLLDTLINTASNPIYFKDAQGIYQGCNNMFAQVLGLSRDQIIGNHDQDLTNDISPEFTAMCQRQEMVMMQKDEFHSFEYQVLCADGIQRDFLFNLAPFRDHDNESVGCVAVLADLTEKNLAAQDRMQKEKLQGVLETAGAVCHELNQPLQTCSGYVEILTATTNDELMLDIIQKIQSQLERMCSITDQLQNITHYEATDYATNLKIIDINRASNTG
ncbi:MAG: PAS domain-containing protein [Desulfobacteraceae bacterium]|nr:PAS domain-containing protein [Desulfobacteraceae bacterium]